MQLEYREQIKENKYLKSLNALKVGLREIVNIAMDLELIYYSAFWVFLIIVACDHPLVVCVHISIVIIRSSIIKDLLIAIFTVSGKIICSLLTLLIAVYWLTIWSYLDFTAYYPDNTCNSLLKCFLVDFDQNFKNNGGVGTYVSTKKIAYENSSSISFIKSM